MVLWFPAGFWKTVRNIRDLWITSCDWTFFFGEKKESWIFFIGVLSLWTEHKRTEKKKACSTCCGVFLWNNLDLERFESFFTRRKQNFIWKFKILSEFVLCLACILKFVCAKLEQKLRRGRFILFLKQFFHIFCLPRIIFTKLHLILLFYLSF